MSAVRMQSAVDGLTGTAAKVYESVPIQHNWTATDIHADMTRRGISIDHHRVRGCLGDLGEQGLVIERGHGDKRTYQRVIVKPRLEKPRLESVRNESVRNESAPPADPVDNFAAIAQTLRAQARALLAQADALDSAALDAAAAIERAGASGEQLRQLKTLLKTITD